MDNAGLLQDLVRYGTLAASSHNTQCWRFQIIDDQGITILPDFSRRCPVVDPEDHHLYVSLAAPPKIFCKRPRPTGWLGR